jgi:hypothetical protein
MMRKIFSLIVLVLFFSCQKGEFELPEHELWIGSWIANYPIPYHFIEARLEITEDGRAEYIEKKTNYESGKTKEKKVKGKFRILDQNNLRIGLKQMEITDTIQFDYALSVYYMGLDSILFAKQD